MSANTTTPRRCPSWTPILLAILTFGSMGCQSQSAEQAAPQPMKVHSIRMLYPPEARTFMTGALERFNAKNLPLSNGAVARLSGASFDDVTATDKIGTMVNEASLWIPPLSALAGDISANGDREISACESLMSSQLGVAVRPIDTFTLPPDRQTLSIGSFLGPTNPSLRSQPAILVGAPRFSSSGLLAALLTVADATHTPLNQIGAQTVRSAIASLTKAQERVRNYVVDDADALQWITSRQGGDPAIVVTSEQAFKSFKTYHPSASLEWLSFTSPGASLDYPLCDITSKTDSPEDLEAAKLARAFLFSEECKSLATTAGFSPPAPETKDPDTGVGSAIRELLSVWPQVRRPSSTTFVVDTSIKTNRATIETIRREISLFIERRPSKDDTVALISASSDPEVMRESTTDPELLKISIDRMTTGGGNAIRDGIETAFNIFEDVASSDYRRSIIVFTSANDSSSQTTVEQLTNRASQLVGRKNVDLFVIAVGGSEQDFGELPAITRKVGGTFVLTDIASLPGNFYGIARRVQ